MKYGIALIARLGLFAPKTEALDLFDLRLQRTRIREIRREVASVLFKNLRRHPEA